MAIRTKETEAEWLRRYLGGEDCYEIMADLWPEIAASSKYNIGSSLKRKYEQEILRGIEKIKADGTPGAFNKIKNLMINAKSETVQLNAAIRWVEMAGHKEPTVIEDKRESIKELQAKANELLADPDTIKALTDNADTAEALRRALSSNTH